MTEIDYWYEKWTALPFTLRHLLLYLLYASGNGDDGVECVLIDRDLLGTEPQELSRSWEVFNIRDGVRWTKLEKSRSARFRYFLEQQPLAQVSS